MNSKSFFITIIGIGLIVFLFSFFRNSDNDDAYVEELLAKAEELHNKRKEGVDEIELNQVLEELDNAFIVVSATRKFYRQVTEIRYLDYLVLEIEDFLVDAQPFKAEQRLKKLFLYLEHNPNHPKYAFYKKQADRLKKNIDITYAANDSSNRSMVSYFKVWLANFYKFEGHFPQDLNEFKRFTKEYDLAFPASYYFESYTLADDYIEIIFSDNSVNKQYEIKLSY